MPPIEPTTPSFLQQLKELGKANRPTSDWDAQNLFAYSILCHVLGASMDDSLPALAAHVRKYYEEAG